MCVCVCVCVCERERERERVREREREERESDYVSFHPVPLPCISFQPILAQLKQKKLEKQT